MTALTARIAVKPETGRKASILGSRAIRWLGCDEKGKLIEFMVNDAWEEAKQAGVVNDAMLEEQPELEKAIAA